MTPEFSHIINGKPQPATAHFDVINPATGAVMAQAPRANAADVEAAIVAAKAAFPGWANRPDSERQAALLAMAQVIEDNAEDLARLLTQEQGKPLAGLGARFEIGGCIAWLRSTAGLTLEVETIQNDAAAHIIVQSKPIGVVAAITPWNWPLMIAVWQFAPAIRAGNTVVLKPSPLTPLATLKMVDLLASVLPPGVLNCIAALDDVAPMLSSHADIGKVSFTGSTATGKRVMAAASETLKRLTLELGGNDAAIVLPDVDAAAIAEGLFWGAFINNGQTCACLKRLYVHDAVYDAVCARLTAVVQAIPMGDGLDEANLMGPIQNAAQFAKLSEMVEDARAKGGKVLIGGAPGAGPGYFYPLTLVAEARHGMRLVDEEQFGPALPIIRYSDIDAVIAQANDSTMGLGASVWSGDAVRAAALVSRLESGIAWVNAHGGLNPNAPFGGVKQSGFGVEFGADGLREFTVRQTVFLR